QRVPLPQKPLRQPGPAPQRPGQAAQEEGHCQKGTECGQELHVPTPPPTGSAGQPAPAGRRSAPACPAPGSTGTTAGGGNPHPPGPPRRSPPPAAALNAGAHSG